FVTHLIETRTGKIVHEIGDKARHGPNFVTGWADGTEFTTDGRYFLYHYREAGGRFLKVWDVAGRKVIGTLSVLFGPAVSPDGKYLFAPTRVPGSGPAPPDPKPGDRVPGQYTVMSLPDLRERCVVGWETFGRPGYPSHSLAVSPDGRRLAAW